MIMLVRKKMIKERIAEVHSLMTEKGWHDEPRELGTAIALIQTEITEAFDSLMDDNVEHFPEELADVLIRIYDTCGEFNIPITDNDQISRPFRLIESRSNGNLELLYMHRCCSKALEAFRKSPEETVWQDIAYWFAELHTMIEEMEDACDFSMNDAYTAKMKKNRSRPHRHGGLRV